MAAFVAGCATGDLDLVRLGLEDVLVEPQRAHLLPLLPEVSLAAVAAGALGCSFSGSGPSVFARALEDPAGAVAAAMAAPYRAAGLAPHAYRPAGHSAGARVDRLFELAAACYFISR